MLIAYIIKEKINSVATLSYLLTIAGTIRKCLYFNECNKKEVHNGKRWKEHWRKYKDKLICDKHYCKLISNPKMSKEYRLKYHRIDNTKTIHFRKKAIYLGWIIRKGICSWCNKKKGEEFITTRGKKSIIITDLHHIEYYIIFPWFATIELCNQCHGIESSKNK